MLDFLRRNASGPFGLALIVLLVLAFSVWGIGDIFRNYDVGTLARIGDREVDAQEFLFRYNRELNRISSELERFVSTEEARESGLDYQILSNLILEKTINSSGDKMKLRPSDKSLVERIKNTNSFRNAFNQFDKNVFNQVLRQNGINEALFLEMERDSVSQVQIYKALFDNLELSKEFNNLIYKFQYEDREIEYVILNMNEFSLEELSLTETDVDHYYKENKQKYKSQPMRNFSLISLLKTDLSSSINVEEDIIREIYQTNIQDYEKPEKRTYYLIPFIDQESANSALINFEKNKDILQIINERGLTVQDVEQISLSIDQGLNSEISKLAFGSNINQLTGTVEGPFGPSLVYVKNIDEASRSSFEEIREQISEDYKSNIIQDKIYSLYNLIEDQRAEGLTFEEISKENSLSLNKYTDVNESGENFFNKDLDESLKDSLLEMIFEANVGIEIEPYEDESGNIIFIRVDDIIEEEFLDFNSIRAEVKDDLITERSKERLNKKSLGYLNAIIDGTSELEEIANNLNVAVLKSEKLNRYTFDEVFSRKAIDQIFKTSLNEPFISDVGIGNSVIIGLVKKIETKEENQERIDIIKNQNEDRIKNELLFALSQELESELESEIFPERLDILFETTASQGLF
ncbi:MAG: SurA N-terminal domain-containing protein [Pseudomonadota bacterium]|nr:SurA N-terminal domain-containing protein [Pseudomonadota bacterium]